MVAYLMKSDASEGFTQVVDFLNRSYIKYDLTVNPDIYVSCIKQFWNTVVIKQVNDVTRLQALVDKKKVVITKVAIREVLRLNDAEGVDCLPNEEIFVELERMGYEKPSTKLTFYKAFFSSQWKFLIHTILQSMSAKRTSWNEFNSAMASAVICLSTGRKFNFSKYIFESLVGNVDRCSKFYMYSRFIQLLIRKQIGDLSTHTTKYTSTALTQKVFANTKRVGKGFSWVETSLFEGMLVEQVIEEGGDEEEHVQDVADSDVAQGADTADQEDDNVGTSQRIDTSKDTVMDDESNQGRIIDEMEKDDVVTLMDDKEEDKKEEEAKVVEDDQEDKPAEVHEVVDVVTTAKLITKVVTAASETVTAASTIISAAKPQVTAATIIVALKKPQTEAQARKNMITYLKNVAGFRLDYFKGMSYDDIRPIFEAKFNSNIKFLLKTKEQMEKEESRALQSINETPAQKATKRRKLNEEVEDLKRHLEIVPDEDDDLILLVERRYPLLRFTLDQMLNAVRRRVEEQSEMSLELLRFTRQQHQEGCLASSSSGILLSSSRIMMSLGVETPLFEGMIVEQVTEEGGDAEEPVQDVTDGDAAQGDDTAAYGKVPTVS
nr:hypothetical protein [Tanacetum cinerariifolium]